MSHFTGLGEGWGPRRRFPKTQRNFIVVAKLSCTASTPRVQCNPISASYCGSHNSPLFSSQREWSAADSSEYMKPAEGCDCSLFSPFQTYVLHLYTWQTTLLAPISSSKLYLIVLFLHIHAGQSDAKIHLFHQLNWSTFIHGKSFPVLISKSLEILLHSWIWNKAKLNTIQRFTSYCTHERSHFKSKNSLCIFFICDFWMKLQQWNDTLK